MSKTPEQFLKLLTFHGCLTGDCPHKKQIDCFEAIYEEGLKDSGNLTPLVSTVEECEEEFRMKAVAIKRGDWVPNTAKYLSSSQQIVGYQDSGHPQLDDTPIYGAFGIFLVRESYDTEK